MKVNGFRRLAALFYDTCLVLALLMLATALLLPFNGGQAVPPGTFVYQLYLAIVSYLYFDYCWRHGGQTLGMKAWKFRCMGAAHHHQTFLRFLGAGASLGTLGLGFILDWPGKWSGTRLVRLDLTF